MKNKIIPLVLVIVGFTIGATALSTFAAWTVPTCTPPSCNVDAPINATSSEQTKKGPLIINFDNVVQLGLKVLGRVQIVDGNQAIGKVLTSDASGVGTWQSMPRIFANFDVVSGNNYSVLRLIGVLDPGTYTVSGKLITSNYGGGGWAGVLMDGSDSLTDAQANSKLSSYYGGTPGTYPDTAPLTGNYYGNNSYDVSRPDALFIMKRNGFNDNTWSIPDTTVTINSRKYVYMTVGQAYISGYIFAR